MTNRWIQHVRDYAKTNNITYKEAMTKAKASYPVEPDELWLNEAPPIKKIKVVNKSPLKKKVIKITKPVEPIKLTQKQRIKRIKSIGALSQLREIRESVPVDDSPLKLENLKAPIYQDKIIKPFIKIYGKLGIIGDTKEEREMNLPIYLKEFIYQLNNYIDVKIWLLLLNDKDETPEGKAEINSLKSRYIKPHIYKMQFRGDESTDPNYEIPENLDAVY